CYPTSCIDELNSLWPRPVDAEERAAGELLVELGAVGNSAGTNFVELFDRQAAGIGGGVQYQRRDGGNQRGFGQPLRAVAADVARHFPATGGEADQEGVLQV